MIYLRIFWDRSFVDLRYRAALHAGFWLFLFFFWLRESVVFHIRWQQHYSVTLGGIGLGLFIFYPLVYGLVPLLQQKRWLWAVVLFVPYYGLAVTWRSYHVEQVIQWYNLKNTWVTGQDFWSRLYKHNFAPLSLVETFFSSLTSLLDLIVIPLGLTFIRWAYQLNLWQARLAQHNAQLQLTRLNAQIHPHFFFNTLNNLQSFIVRQDQLRSVELLTRLADFMRTSLYECSGETIRMEQELTLLRNYIAIEQVRFGPEATIQITFVDQDSAYPIPPFMFLPFLENAFKYGGQFAAADVRIQIELCNQPERVVLITRNRFHPETLDRPAGGIGQTNARQRLAYYFPGQHTLAVESSGGIYYVQLEIQKR